MRGVFLDRDGVINDDVDLLHKAEQLRLLPGVARAIRRLNQRGLPVVIATNQSVIARGMITPSKLASIHRHLRWLLALRGARIDAIFYCPFHEDADVAFYRQASADRKPRPGMLKKAARLLSLDLPRCFVVGDRTTDIEAGRRAGCTTILVRTGCAGLDARFAVKPDGICNDLPEAVQWILRRIA
ncbi:MAG: HAD family hydrolase [Bryobacterales bacterium]|nr:HAD family hydrolase [Bryobacterales bacterium]